MPANLENTTVDTGLEKVSFHSNPKNIQTTVQLCSFHILVRLCSKSFKYKILQQYVNWELPDVQAGFSKGRGTRDQIAIGNMYNIIYETSHQFRFDARYWMLEAGVLGWPIGMVCGGRREEGSGWVTPRVYLWRSHVDIWQNQYNIVKLKNKIK